MSDMSIRDHFAAAALAGLLAQGDDGSFSEEYYVRGAYRWADVMLRERERTNHDAVPAAITVSDEDRTDKAATSHRRDRSGNTPVAESATTAEPVAWALVYPNDEVAVIAFKRVDADEHASASDRVVPLYRHPLLTLTDAEREAVEAAQNHIDGYDGKWGDEIAATLRGLLERLK